MLLHHLEAQSKIAALGEQSGIILVSGPVVWASVVPSQRLPLVVIKRYMLQGWLPVNPVGEAAGYLPKGCASSPAAL